MRRIESEEQLLELLRNRPETTQTFSASRELIPMIPQEGNVQLRVMNKDEVQTLAAYLGVEAERLDGPFRVVDARCEHCGRRITFLDFVKTAVDHGQHNRDDLHRIVTGQGGSWITIRGRDGGRPVHCALCGRVAMVRSDGYSEYSSSSYAYA